MMERQIIKWVKSASRAKAAPPRLLTVKGPLGAGKSSLALEVASIMCAAPYKKKVVLISPYWGRQKFARGIDARDLPLTAEILVESAHSSLFRVLKANVSTDVPTGTHVNVLSRAELIAFLNANIYSLPAPQLRPFLEPTSYVVRLADYIETLFKSELSVESFRSWLEEQKPVDDESLFDRETQRDLCSTFDAFKTLANQKAVVTGESAFILSRKTLKDVHILPRSRLSYAIWDFSCDLLLIDDFHLFPPNQARFLATLASKTAQNTIAFCDDDGNSIDRFKITSSSRNNLPFLLSLYKDQENLTITSTRIPPEGKYIFLDPNESELKSISDWILSLPEDGKDIYVVTPSETIRDDMVAALSSRHSDRLAIKPCGDSRISLTDMKEGRDVLFFLNALLRGTGGAADSALFAVFVSRLFQYNPTPEDIRYLGELRTRRGMSMKQALGEIEKGRTFLQHFHHAEAKAASGMPLSKLASFILEETGVIARLNDSESEADSDSTKRLTELLRIIVTTEYRLGGSGALVIPPSPLDVISYLETMNTFTSLDSEESTIQLEKHRDQRRREVKIASMAHINAELAPCSVDHICLTRATDSFLIPKRSKRPFELPWKLLSSPRPADDIDDLGPFLDDTLRHDREALIESQRRLLESIRAKSTQNTLVCSVNVGEQFSKLLRPESKSTSTIAVEKSRSKNNGLSAVRSISSLSSMPAKSNDPVITLSYSRMYEYETCPKRYYMSRVLGIQTPSNPRMVYGKALHAGVEAHHLETQRELKLSAAQSAFTTQFEEQLSGKNEPIPHGFHSDSHIRDISSNGMQILETFHRRWMAKPSLSEPKAVEYRFEVELKDLSISLIGVIDLIEKSKVDGTLRIVDYKSNVTSNTKLNRIGKQNDQLALYAWIVGSDLETPIASVAIESIETGNRFESQPGCPDHMRERLNQVAHNVRNERFSATPSYSSCLMCPFRDICDDADAAAKRR